MHSPTLNIYHVRNTAICERVHLILHFVEETNCIWYICGAMVPLLRHQISLATNTLYVNEMSPFSRYQVSNLATEKNTPPAYMYLNYM